MTSRPATFWRGGLIVLLAGLLGACESTAPTTRAQKSAVLQARSTGQSTADRKVRTWDGQGAIDVEFGRVVQVRDITISGQRLGFWGTATGAVAGGAATRPKRATTSEVLTATAGAVTGAIIGESTHEMLTRKEGQEVVVQLEEGRVVTVTQTIEHGRLTEGDAVKVVYSPQGAYTSLTNPDERASVKASQREVQERGRWYEEDSVGGP